MFAVDTSRLAALDGDFSVAELENHRAAADRICKGGNDAGDIGRLSLGERFRWLTAPRSTVLQMSPVHSGLTVDADETLADLFEKLVK